VHGLREAQRARDGGKNVQLWPFGRATAWRRVHEVMHRAGIDGPQASPKGLRHGFGVAAVQAGIPLNMVQKWLGARPAIDHGDLCGCRGRRGTGNSGEDVGVIMCDVSKLKMPEECRTVMQRARDKGLDDTYNLVFRRYCELVGRELAEDAASNGRGTR